MPVAPDRTGIPQFGEDEQIILSREVNGESGRSVARINGRAVSISRLDMGKFRQRTAGAGGADTTSQLLGFQHLLAKQGPDLVPDSAEFR